MLPLSVVWFSIVEHRYIELFCNSTPGGLGGNSGGFGGDMGSGGGGNSGGGFGGNMGGGGMGGNMGGGNMGGGGYTNSGGGNMGGGNMGGGGYNSGGNFGGNMGGGGGKALLKHDTYVRQGYKCDGNNNGCSSEKTGQSPWKLQFGIIDALYRSLCA